VPWRDTIEAIGKRSVNHTCQPVKTKCAPAPLTMQEVFTMDKNYWENPVALRLPHLGLRTVENTYDAAAYLMEEWPVDHGRPMTGQSECACCRFVERSSPPPRGAHSSMRQTRHIST